MAKKLQLRRGTTSQHSSFTGAVGEVTVDTDKDVLVVHDGSTAGGHASVKSGAIAAGDIASNAVTTAKINADAVTGAKIADDSIDSEHYVDGSIDNAHLADDAVGVAELSATGTASSSTFLRGDNAWAVVDTTNASNLSTGTLPIARIADGAITSAKIADGTVVQADVADNAVTTAKIVNSAVTSAKIADGTIVGGDIGNTTITGGNLVNSTITTTQLANDAVTSAKIADGTIVDGNISSATISGGKLQSGTITGTQIANATLSGAKLQTSTITGAYLATNAVTNVKVADDAIGVAELSASGTANSSSFLRGDNQWAVPGGGKIKQVNTTHVTTFSTQSYSNQQLINVTGCSVQITPTSSSSRIWVFAHWSGESSGDPTDTQIGLKRNTTYIGAPTGGGSNQSAGIAHIFMGYYGQDMNTTMDSCAYNYIDSPSTTSSTMYYLIWRSGGSGTLYNNRTKRHSNVANDEVCASWITAMEIGA